MGMSVQNDVKQTQKKLVFGLGQTGLSCVRYLVAQGHKVCVFDTRSAPPGLDELRSDYPNVEIKLERLDKHSFDDVEQIILSPGISLKSTELTIARERKIEIVGDIELFVKHAKAPIIAITGSNGKTTTTTLVGEILKLAGKDVGVGGNIGTPVLDLLDLPVPDYYLLELSSFQLETTKSLRAEIAVVLNISPDHMDRYDSLDDYAISKLIIFNEAKNKIINYDDDWLRDHIAVIGEYVCFSKRMASNIDYGLLVDDRRVWIVAGKEKIIEVSKLRLQGQHQVMNAVAAVAIADLCDVDPSVTRKALEAFNGLAHRTQFVAVIDGVTYINDSKGTNVGATVAAIEGLDSDIILLAGGDSKGADFSELATAVKGKVRIAILFGRDAGLIERSVGDYTKVIRAMSLNAAVSQAKKLARKNETVLLSPACASFDMFKNYQQRGDVFMELVRKGEEDA